MKLIKIISLYTIFSLFKCLEKDIETNETNQKTNYTSYFTNSTIDSINDTSFEKIINKGIDNDFLILFTIRRCDICNDLITTLENLEKKYLNNKENNIKFYKIDCLMNGWTAMRFTLERIPNIIYITKGLYSVYLNDNFTENDIELFIKNKTKEYKPYPKIMGYFDLFMKIFHAISDLMKENYPFWKESYSWIILILFLVVFCVVEYYIFKYFCTKNQKNKNEDNDNYKNHKNHHHHHNE